MFVCVSVCVCVRVCVCVYVSVPCDRTIFCDFPSKAAYSALASVL